VLVFVCEISSLGWLQAGEFSTQIKEAAFPDGLATIGEG
jgi:hypothetical protein